jgi:rhamnosyltransferase
MNNPVFPVTSEPQFWVVVPTYNPGKLAWADWVLALQNQNCKPMQVVVVDSGSTDGSLEISQKAGFTLLHVLAKDFNHGGTRQWALDQALSLNKGHLDQPQYAVFLTQDAVLASKDALQELLKAFLDPEVAACFGRQLAKQEASWIENHARLFNYPETSRTVQLIDKKRMGIKACFFSNSFAGYRLDALQAQGGFPTNLPLGEDAYMAAKFLVSGQYLRYQASSAVYHSHNYKWQQDFQRMFDTGVFHAQSPWLLKCFGTAEGEGIKLVASQWKYLNQIVMSKDVINRPSLLAGIYHLISLNLIKLLGYKLGKAHRFFPVGLSHHLSMNKYFWKKQ